MVSAKYGWSDITSIAIFSVDIDGAKSVSYKAVGEKTEVPGIGRKMIGWVDGAVKCEAEATIYYGDWLKIENKLAQFGINPLDAKGTVSMSVEKKGEQGKYITIKVYGLKEVPYEASAGNDASEVKLSFYAYDIEVNGKSVLPA